MEIKCRKCGTVAIARPEPVYEGFKKTATSYICTECGEVYPTEAETPFVSKPDRPALFSEEDKPEVISIFDDDERRRCCSWCRHFVVNPFSQRCGLTNRETDATDICPHFEPA